MENVNCSVAASVSRIMMVCLLMHNSLYFNHCLYANCELLTLSLDLITV